MDASTRSTTVRTLCAWGVVCLLLVAGIGCEDTGDLEAAGWDTGAPTDPGPPETTGGPGCKLPKLDTLTFIPCDPPDRDFALPVIQAWMTIDFDAGTCALMGQIPQDHGQVDDLVLDFDADNDDTFSVTMQTLRIRCASHGTLFPGATSDGVLFLPPDQEIILDLVSDDLTKHGVLRATFSGPELSARVAGVAVAFP